jgi:hypothetical protein
MPELLDDEEGAAKRGKAPKKLKKKKKGKKAEGPGEGLGSQEGEDAKLNALEKELETQDEITTAGEEEEEVLRSPPPLGVEERHVTPGHHPQDRLNLIRCMTRAGE